MGCYYSTKSKDLYHSMMSSDPSLNGTHLKVQCHHQVLHRKTSLPPVVFWVTFIIKPVSGVLGLGFL